MVLINILVLILVVIKIYTALFNYVAAYKACRSRGVLINIAFVWLLLVK